MKRAKDNGESEISPNVSCSQPVRMIKGMLLFFFRGGI